MNEIRQTQGHSIILGIQSGEWSIVDLAGIE